MRDLINTYLGQFRLIEVIGRGGQFTVYKAYQSGLERYVAIKVLPHSSDPHLGTHFKLAAQEIAKVHHPNLVRIYDYHEQDDLRYLVLQYIEGGATLADMLGKPLDPTTAVQLVGQLLDALDYAHGEGVIHGDIKPANILITTSGEPMLTDFGIVKRMNESQHLTLSGLVVGDPPYMAPEVATGRMADTRTDLYAMGVVLYELLTGRVPFEAGTPMAVLAKHVYEVPPPLSRFNPELPVAIEAVLSRALAKDPAGRYQRAAEMAQELTYAAMQLPQNRAANQLTSLYQVGVQAFAAGRWDVAIERFSQLLMRDPSHEDAAELLAAAQDAQERTKAEAQRHLQLGRQRQQSTTDVHFQPPTSTPGPTAMRETIQFTTSDEPATANLPPTTATPTLSAEANKAIVHRWIEEAWNKGNIAVVGELLVSHFTEETKQAIIRWRTAFPDGHVTIEEMVAEGDTVIVRWTFCGTHQGGFPGGPPAGTPVTVPGLSIDRVTDGKIVHSTNWTMMQQRGVIPMPGPAVS